MTAVHATARDQGMTLRQAALVAGFGPLIMTMAAPFAEFIVYRELVVPGNIEATTENILERRGLSLAGLLGYLRHSSGPISCTPRCGFCSIPSDTSGRSA